VHCGLSSPASLCDVFSMLSLRLCPGPGKRQEYNCLMNAVWRPSGWPCRDSSSASICTNKYFNFTLVFCIYRHWVQTHYSTITQTHYSTITIESEDYCVLVWYDLVLRWFVLHWFTFTILVELDWALPTCGAALSQLKHPFST